VSNVSKRPRDEGRRVPRRTDEMARDLEFLAQRLAESREAIVRLLATEAGPEDSRDEEPPSGPRLLRNAGEGTEPVRPGTDGLPAVVVSAPDNQASGPEHGTDIVSTAAASRRTSVARRRLLAVVLLAVGAVVVLTTLVSLL
jgi:hypothetical protein